MLKLDTLSQLKQLKKEIKASRNLEEGVVKGSAYKFGFVTLDSGRDVYLPPDQMERVLPGDRVEVEIVKDAKNKKVAKLEKLIDSPTKFFCGKYITKGKTHFVEPDINGMTRWFFVPPNKRKDAKMKDLVACRITQHPFKSGKAQAAVNHIIGTEHDKGIETRYAIQKHAISAEWNAQALQELASYDEILIDKLKEERTDLSEISFVTIDADTTNDIDDALFAEKTEKGWKLLIAIADPSAVIKENSEIDKEAIKRGNSVYFPGLQIPMLPKEISSDICSLVENKQRLAKVLSIEITDLGELQSHRLEEAFITNHKKMSYDEVSSLLEGEGNTGELAEPIYNSIKQLEAISAILASKRADNFIYPERRKEFYFELDESGKPSAIKPKLTTPAHRLVEEMMIVANRCIAQTLSESGSKSIFITHDGIREDRLESLDKVLAEELDDYEAGDISHFEKFVDCYRKQLANAESDELRLLISRQLEKSKLSSEPKPHFGMGLPNYTNFTSPLRKASDYLIHRQLSSLLKGQKKDIDTELASKLEESGQNSRSAVYDVEQWLRCQFLANNETKLEATVLRVFSSGFQVKLIENGIEGFVSTKEMEEKFSFNQERLSLSSKTHQLKLDSPVTVTLKHIDWSRKQIQFNLVD